MNRIVIDALGWTLVHFLWQGALIAAALCVADLVLAKAKATARYLVACVAFAVMLAVPARTFFLFSSQPHAPAHRAAFSAASTMPAASLTLAEPDAPARFSGARTSLLASRPPFARLLPWVVGL